MISNYLTSIRFSLSGCSEFKINKKKKRNGLFLFLLFLFFEPILYSLIVWYKEIYFLGFDPSN